MARNYFTDQTAFKTIDSRRIIYVLIAIVFYLITEFGRFVYRPYVYSNAINDFGIADSIGNLGGILVQIYVTLAILNPPKIKGVRIIAFLVMGYIIYEMAQPYLPKGVFDWKDIFGTLIGGGIALLLFWAVYAIKGNRIIYKFQSTS